MFEIAISLQSVGPLRGLKAGVLAIAKHYARGDSQFFDIILPRFHSEGGIKHGLIHHRSNDQKPKVIGLSDSS